MICSKKPPILPAVCPWPKSLPVNPVRGLAGSRDDRPVRRPGQQQRGGRDEFPRRFDVGGQAVHLLGGEGVDRGLDLLADGVGAPADKEEESERPRTSWGGHGGSGLSSAGRS